MTGTIKPVLEVARAAADHPSVKRLSAAVEFGELACAAGRTTDVCLQRMCSGHLEVVHG